MISTTKQPIRFGFSLPNRAVVFGLPTRALLEAADCAEASGRFDSIWVGDNFLFTPRLESIVLLSAVAARTERVRLGTICMASFPLRNPLQLAIQWASLDLLSGGRTILAVCLGKGDREGPRSAAEIAAFGVASRSRVTSRAEMATPSRPGFPPRGAAASDRMVVRPSTFTRISKGAVRATRARSSWSSRTSRSARTTSARSNIPTIGRSSRPNRRDAATLPRVMTPSPSTASNASGM